MSYSPAIAAARGALSNHHRWHPEDAEGLTERRRNLATEKLAAYIESTLAAAPALTDDQVNRLVQLVRAGGAR